MDDEKIKEAVKKLKESKKRNFKQTVDLIINLRGLDLKKPEHQVEFFLQLPRSKGKKSKICALVGAELGDQAKKVMDNVVMQTDFDKFSKDKRLAKKLAREFDFFVAQANIMPKVATAFGRTFGPIGKMPNPKAGCIVPPNANLQTLYGRLQQTTKISGKKTPILQTVVGSEESSESDLIDNIKYVFSNTVHNLPQGESNIKSMFLKFSMGNPIKVI